MMNAIEQLFDAYTDNATAATATADADVIDVRADYGDADVIDVDLIRTQADCANEERAAKAVSKARGQAFVDRPFVRDTSERMDRFLKTKDGAEWYRTWFTAAQRTAPDYGGCADLADDIRQEALARVLRNESYAGKPMSELCWIVYRACVNCALDLRRKAKRNPWVGDAQDAVLTKAIESPDYKLRDICSGVQGPDARMRRWERRDLMAEWEDEMNMSFKGAEELCYFNFARRYGFSASKAELALHAMARMGNPHPILGTASDSKIWSKVRDARSKLEQFMADVD